MWRNAEEFLAKDQFIGPLVKKYGHCTIKPRVHTNFFQALVGEIIGQQLSGRVADVIYDRLKKKVKGRLTPDKILLLEDQKLRDCGMAWAKVRSIKDLADKVKKREVKIKSLDKLSDEEVARQLISVKGIGRWTSEMFLMFSLGRPDIFPDDDLGIRKGMAKLLGRALASDEMIKFARRWKPHRTVASWYLWRSLEND